MKKFFSLLNNKSKKDADDLNLHNEEEVKHPLPSPEEDKDHDNSTKDKDSNSDDQNRESRLEDIRRSQLDKKIKRIDEVLSTKIIDLDKLKNLAWGGIPSNTP